MLLLCACAGAAAQGQSDWEREQGRRQWTEGAVTLPATPQPANLLPFFVSAASDFRFFVDGASLSVGKDGVVRYTLVARSPQGVENVSYEGMRCESREVRGYATRRADGSWSRRDTPWRRILPRNAQRWHNALAAEYFCPGKAAIQDAAEGVEALRRGGHPRAGLAPGS